MIKEKQRSEEIRKGRRVENPDEENGGGQGRRYENGERGGGSGGGGGTHGYNFHGGSQMALIICPENLGGGVLASCGIPR